jgi:hypothetical protein
VNPKTAATIATMKKMRAQRSIVLIISSTTNTLKLHAKTKQQWNIPAQFNLWIFLVELILQTEE